MGTLRFYNNSANCTLVANHFVDTLMPSANGEFVKVYLYLLRISQGNMNPVSVSDLADLFNNTENDILRALRYWERQQLLTLTYSESGELDGIAFSNEASHTESAPAASVKQPSPVSAAVSSSSTASAPVSSKATVSAAVTAVTSSTVRKEAERHTYTADELQKFQENPEIMELFFIIESYLKRTLSATDTNMVLFWYDELGFPVELIEYLVEYCLSKGHSSVRYMDKVALGWADSGIHTIEEAKENASSHSQLYYAVIKALGIHGRSLVPPEMEYIQKWNKTWGMDQELIIEACSRTIAATHQPSFEYTDGILTNWHNANVQKLDDVKKLDEVHSLNRKSASNKNNGAVAAANNRFNNFNQRTYDEQELEKILLNSSLL